MCYSATERAWQPLLSPKKLTTPLGSCTYVSARCLWGAQKLRLELTFPKFNRAVLAWPWPKQAWFSKIYLAADAHRGHLWL